MLCSYIAHTVLSETTETVWSCTRGQLMFYKSVIVPITEYACPVWHTSLTKNDDETLENIQKSNVCDFSRN